MPPAPSGLQVQPPVPGTSGVEVVQTMVVPTTLQLHVPLPPGVAGSFRLHFQSPFGIAEQSQNSLAFLQMIDLSGSPTQMIGSLGSGGIGVGVRPVGSDPHAASTREAAIQVPRPMITLQITCGLAYYSARG